MAEFELLFQEKKKTKAVVLLSGGMDSTTLLYYCLKIHKDVHVVIIDYNQRHKKEIKHAKRIASEKNVPLTQISIQFPKYKGSPLVDQKAHVPDQSDNEQGVTVVPLRNTFFLLHGCAVATSINATDVYLGAVKDDQLSYPDCRPDYFKAFQQMLQAQESKVIINYPFVHYKKSKIIALGQELNVPWELTWTCYNGREKACGTCDACKERLVAFKENKLKDPISYE